MENNIIIIADIKITSSRVKYLGYSNSHGSTLWPLSNCSPWDGW